MNYRTNEQPIHTHIRCTMSVGRSVCAVRVWQNVYAVNVIQLFDETKLFLRWIGAWLCVCVCQFSCMYESAIDVAFVYCWLCWLEIQMLRMTSVLLLLGCAHVCVRAYPTDVLCVEWAQSTSGMSDLSHRHRTPNKYSAFSVLNTSLKQNGTKNLLFLLIYLCVSGINENRCNCFVSISCMCISPFASVRNIPFKKKNKEK